MTSKVKIDRTKWDALRSSKSDEYPTPPDVYEQLDNEFNFTLDPCATDENHKCEKYFTKEHTRKLYRGCSEVSG